MDVKGLERTLGASIRALRTEHGLTRDELARLSNASIGAVRNLELGYGSSIATLVRVVHALDADDWLTALTPDDDFDPFDVLRNST